MLLLALADPSQLSAAMEMLKHSTNLHDQVDLLHYVYSCNDLNFVISLNDGVFATVRELLEEVYQKAASLKLWNIVRQAAGLLRKVVNSLTINLTDLLIRQKQVTIGFGSKGLSLIITIH
jgi:hypothetical protein